MKPLCLYLCNFICGNSCGPKNRVRNLGLALVKGLKISEKLGAKLVNLIALPKKIYKLFDSLGQNFRG